MSRRATVHRRLRGPVGLGAIACDRIYPLRTFLRRSGLGRNSLAALRKRGLAVHETGRKLFVDGAEAVEFLRGLWAQEEGGE